VRVLVLGGSASGKSRYAESLFDAGSAVTYLAASVADPDDAEWAQRVRRHRERRPGTWSTVESTDLAGVLAGAAQPLLIDSVTTWLAAAMDAAGAWDGTGGDDLAARVDAVVAAWRGTGVLAVAVSDEVGSGVVPDTRSGRLFRDELGRLNQALAASADQVWLVVAGIPSRLK
jgi:adenosylcobinamide kinase/adenosylcobinamide-phosphate guanylyltransferase